MQLLHKPFYFIRHGETAWNRDAIVMGSSDVPLNTTGINQAESAANVLQHINFTAIATSPLLRARQTAEIIAAKNPTPITIINDLQECNWGDLEGTPWDDMIFERWMNNTIANNVESFADFTKRIFNGINRALQLSNKADANILIVSHGGVYIAVQKALRFPIYDISNCKVLSHVPISEPDKTDNTQTKASWKVTEIN